MLWTNIKKAPMEKIRQMSSESVKEFFVCFVRQFHAALEAFAELLSASDRKSKFNLSHKVFRNQL